MFWVGVLAGGVLVGAVAVAIGIRLVIWVLNSWPRF